MKNVIKRDTKPFTISTRAIYSSSEDKPINSYDIIGEYDLYLYFEKSNQHIPALQATNIIAIPHVFYLFPQGTRNRKRNNIRKYYSRMCASFLYYMNKTGICSRMFVTKELAGTIQCKITESLLDIAFDKWYRIENTGYQYSMLIIPPPGRAITEAPLLVLLVRHINTTKISSNMMRDVMQHYGISLLRSPLTPQYKLIQ